MAFEYHDDLESANTALRKAHDEIVSLKATAIRAEDAYKRLRVSVALRDEARKAGVLPTAEEDAVSRAWAMGEWTIDKNGRITLLDNGLTAINEVGDAMTPAVVIRQQLQTAGHLYGKPTGTPTNGNDGPNPWLDGPTWNMTEQGRILTTDPARARRLAAAAGKTIRE